MKFSELLEHSIECIKQYNSIIKTVDSHADEYLKDFKDPYEKVFIKQVFYGWTRYMDFLKTFTKIFFETHAAKVNRNDATLYQIFAYLSFFRLDELQITDFKRLVQSQEPTKMNVFLQFAFNADLLREHVRDEWITLYDHIYVDETIIGGVERHLPAVKEILTTVEKRATGKVTSTYAQSVTESHMGTDAGGRKSVASLTGGLDQSASATHFDDVSEGGEPVKKVTEQVPFNLTKAKPKMIPAPEVIKKEVKANPVPKGMFKKTLADIEKEKKERRMATINMVRQEYEGNDKKRFNLATEQRPTVQKKEVVKQAITQKRDAECNFSGIKAKKAPNFQKKEAVVKLNAAALKREGHLLDKEEREEAQKLKEMAMGLKDASEFTRWQREMEQKDDIERIEHIQKKKIEMELAREAAIQAQEAKEQENHILVQKMKIESEKRLDEREKNLHDDFLKRKGVIEAVHSQKDKASLAMAEKERQNKAIRDEVNRELAEANKRRQDEIAFEQAKKQELIRQIRELEKIPIQRTKGFDPTEAGGHGLMEEMSVAELRERLEFQRREREQEVDFKREQNLLKKEKEANKLLEDAKKIEEARLRRKAANDARRANTMASEAQSVADKQAMREKGLLEVFEKINQKKKEKREEEERLAKELKEIKLQRQYLNANAAMVEEKAWKELEAGKERQIRDEQNFRLIQQCKVNAIDVKDQIVRSDNAKTSVIEKLTYDKSYQDRLQTRKKENEVLHKNTLEYKSQMHAKQQDFKTQLSINQKKRNPFIAKVNEQSLARATAFRNKQNAQGATQFEETIDLYQMDDEAALGAEDFGGESALDLMGEEGHDSIADKLEMEV